MNDEGLGIESIKNVCDIIMTTSKLENNNSVPAVTPKVNELANRNTTETKRGSSIEMPF